MDEHGAAPAGDAGPRVVVDFDEEVVEVVVAPEPVAWFIGRAPERPVVAPVGRVLAPGVAGRCGAPAAASAAGNWRSARHHSRSGRKRPRGVPPSPSRLSARMPARPSATGMASGPANSQPCDRRPGRERTWSDRSDVRRMLPRFLCPAACPNEFSKCRLLFIRECSTSREAARQNRAKVARAGRHCWGSD